MHPLNLALRFMLELAALAGFAMFAWQANEGVWRIIFAFLAVLIVMIVWGTFAVPDDPSRSGNAPIVVPGLLRLLLELAILFGGALAFYFAGHAPLAIGLSVLTIMHYALSLERIMWILQQ